MKTTFALFLTFFVLSATISQEVKQPKNLKKGDIIAIIAPAGALKNGDKNIKKAKEIAQSWGLKVVFGTNVLNSNHHFAGTDKERISDFQKALDNKNIKAIWSARGGYGSVRLLDTIDFTKFRNNPKWLIGYSDITAFHNHIHNFGIETMHAIMPVNFGDSPEKIKKSVASFKKALFGQPLRYKIPSSKYNRIGAAKGQLIGGNISILASMLGSESQISTEGKILFLEDIGEYKYSIDRMLFSLKRAGYFKNLNAVIVGGMTSIKDNNPKWGSTIEELILNVIPKNIPVLFDFPAGHDADNRALLFGRNVKLTIGKKKSSLVFK